MEKVIIRKAKMGDVNQIRRLINSFANEGKMLPVSLNMLYERLRNFWVVEIDKKVAGCAALKIVWKDLGEIRSVAIARKHQGSGYGKNLVKKALEEAELLEIKKVFTLTYIPEFFGKLGFEKIIKSKLPHKVWSDCINCPKFPRCDETAMLKVLKK
ncbi:MAG: N-acetyltransferase [Candidatus Ratteibacteria bacterium]|nr:N-acetyltransferase [Candidatus Ratteibacteria bacterium]